MLCKCSSDLINRRMKWLSQSWLKSITVIRLSPVLISATPPSSATSTRLILLHPRHLSSLWGIAKQNGFCLKKSDKAHSASPASSARLRLFITRLHFALFAQRRPRVFIYFQCWGRRCREGKQCANLAEQLEPCRFQFWNLAHPPCQPRIQSVFWLLSTDPIHITSLVTAAGATAAGCH